MTHVNRATSTGPATRVKPAAKAANTRVDVNVGMVGNQDVEPLPAEMFWVPAPTTPCYCEDCDEYLWPRNMRTHD